MVGVERIEHVEAVPLHWRRSVHAGISHEAPEESPDIFTASVDSPWTDNYGKTCTVHPPIVKLRSAEG